MSARCLFLCLSIITVPTRPLWGRAQDTEDSGWPPHHQLPSEPTSRRRPLEGHVTPHTSLLKKIQWPSLILNSSPRLPGLRRELSSLAPVRHSTLPESVGLSDAWSHSSSIPGPFYFQNWRITDRAPRPSLLCPPLPPPFLLSARLSSSLRVPVLQFSIGVDKRQNAVAETIQCLFKASQISRDFIIHCRVLSP